MYIAENKKMKFLRSDEYNYDFNKDTGLFIRWGKTLKDDPEFASFGSEILDMEISTSVPKGKEHLYPEDRLVYEGGCKGSCDFCYKSNKYNLLTYNMTFEEFKIVFHKMPKPLTQIAFGIMNIDTNKDFFKMMEYAKENGVIPNFTCHGLDDLSEEDINRISKLCGAVAVSVYNKDKSYNTIKKLTDAGMKQINIHYMISEETYENVFNIIDDVKQDVRLQNLNAIVFLSLKQKGRGANYNILSFDKFCNIISYAEKNKIAYGMDSCSANKYIKYLKEIKKDESMLKFVEPCESSLMSSYVNAKGDFYVCSFAENDKDGLSVLDCNDFLEDIWYNEKTINFRKTLLKNKRNCPLYKI